MTTASRHRPALLSLFLACALATPLLAANPPTYDDQIHAIFAEHCFGCHNPDRHKDDLDLTTFTTLMTGSSSGKIVIPGNPDGSTLYQVLTRQKEPFMPPNKPKIPDAQLDLIKRWIEAGLKENAGSKAQPAAPKVNLALAPTATGKPKGAPAMPGLLPLEPVVHTDRLNCPIALAHSPWAPLVALGGQHQILLYNSDTRELLGVLPFAEGFPDTLTFSRSGALLVAGGGRGAALGRVVLFDVATGRRLATLGQEYDAVLAADLSPDQTAVALGGPGKLVKVLNVSDGKLRYTIKKHTDWVLALAFSPDGVLLASGDRGGGLYVWEARTGENFYELRGHTGAITALSWRPDSNLLASASEDGTVRLWDMSSGNQVKSWQAHAGGVEDVRYSGDGKLVTAGRDKSIKVWDGDGRELRTFGNLPDLATRATFNQDGKRVIGGDWTGHVEEWPVDADKSLGELDANPPTLAMRIAAIEKKIAATRAEAKALAPADDAAAVHLAAQMAADDLAAAQHRLQQLDHPSPATSPATTQPAGAKPQVLAAMAAPAATRPTGAAAPARADPAADREALTKLIGTMTELAHSKADKAARLDQVNARLASLEKDHARWQRAQLFQSLCEAKLRLADQQAQAQRARQAAAAAQEAVQPEMTALAAAEKDANQPKADAKKARERTLAAQTALAQAQAQVSATTAASKAADEQLALALEEVDDLTGQFNGAPPRRRAVLASAAGAATQPGAAAAGIAGRSTLTRIEGLTGRHGVMVVALTCLALIGWFVGLLALARHRSRSGLGTRRGRRLPQRRGPDDVVVVVTEAAGFRVKR